MGQNGKTASTVGDTCGSDKFSVSDLNIGTKDPFGIDEGPKISWKFGIYKIRYNVKRFFCGPSRMLKAKPELNLEDTVNVLLANGPDYPPQELIDKCQAMLKQQRFLEDTRARRRLEKWAKRVITIYLIAVGMLVLVNGLCALFLDLPVQETYSTLLGKSEVRGFISDSVLTVILTTTTINVIGLGVIVLKGHFSYKEEPNTESKPTNK